MSAPGFPHVLAAEAVPNFGTMLSRLAIPWLATLTLGATALQMAALLGAEALALAVGLFALAALLAFSGRARFHRT